MNKGRKKVFIIQDAQELTAEASNSLLKVLEESSRDSLIILIASDIRRIYPTVSSRCQKVMFYAKGCLQAEEVLLRDYNLSKPESHFLAFVFEGRLGDALDLKDNNLLKDRDDILRYFILNPQTTHQCTIIKDKERFDLLIRILVSFVRDMYLLKSGVQEEILINADISNKLAVVARGYSFKELDILLRALVDILSYKYQNINRRLLIDNLRFIWKK